MYTVKKSKDVAKRDRQYYVRLDISHAQNSYKMRNVIY